MKFEKVVIGVLTGVIALACIRPSWSAPVDQPEAGLTRVSGQNRLQADLTRNVFQTKYREEVYTVDVPYTVSIPYSSIESVSVPYRQCSSQYRCSSVPGSCRSTSSEVCKTDSNGKRNCTTVPRRDCDPPRQSCGHENVCQTHYRSELRTVTRYRSETRYRQESRSRTVSYQEFVRQWGRQILIEFPNQAELQPGEEELLQLSLSHDESQPLSKLDLSRTLYGYEEVSRENLENEVRIQLGIRPLFNETNATQNSIQQTVLKDGEDQTSVVFIDYAHHPRVVNHYEIEVIDQDTNQTVATIRKTQQSTFQEWKEGNRKINIALGVLLHNDHDHLVKIKVKRGGDSLVLTQDLDFTVEHVLTAKVNSALYSDTNSLSELDVRIENGQVKVSVQDLAPAHRKVRNYYYLKVLRATKFLGLIRDGWKELFSITLEEPVFNITELNTKLSALRLSDHSAVRFELVASRISDRFVEPQSEQILKVAKSVNLKFRPSKADKAQIEILKD